MAERRLRELATLFVQLGLTAFGGPAAHVAIMEREIVRRRGWLSREEFLDLLSAANLIPGPNSTELAIHIGRRRGGVPGLVVAGACFILPAVLLTMILAWVYVRVGTLPRFTHVLHGVEAVIVAVVLQALWSLGRTVVSTPARAIVATSAILASALGLHELLVLGAAGLAMVLPVAWRRRATLVPVIAWIGGGSAASSPIGFGLFPLFLFFLKVGAVLYGSGYVLLAFLRADLVQRWHWMTEAQLVDAVAAGQITPGPVFSTATFIGFVLGGVPGSLLATAGIFLPAFFFVTISGPLVPRLRGSPAAAAFLDGVNLGSLALMGVVTWHLARAVLVDPVSLAICVLAAIALIRFEASSAWLVLLGAAAGALRGALFS